MGKAEGKERTDRLGNCTEKADPFSRCSEEDRCRSTRSVGQSKGHKEKALIDPPKDCDTDAAVMRSRGSFLGTRYCCKGLHIDFRSDFFTIP